jgi:hypothetical protein
MHLKLLTFLSLQKNLAQHHSKFDNIWKKLVIIQTSKARKKHLIPLIIHSYTRRTKNCWQQKTIHIVLCELFLDIIWFLSLNTRVETILR